MTDKPTDEDIRTKQAEDFSYNGVIIEFINGYTVLTPYTTDQNNNIWRNSGKAIILQ